MKPLISFSAAVGSRCPRRPCKLPTLREYTRAFRAFRKRWPDIKTISPWNEANHRSQPTFKQPKRAAQYYNIVRKYCRGCKIVAADVIDDRNMERWLAVFKKYARKPRIWGLHNYRDVNPRKNQMYGGTKRLLQTVRGQVWMTETGGLARFQLPGGKTLFPYSLSRQNRAIKRMFSLAKRYRARVKQLFIYNWWGQRRSQALRRRARHPDRQGPAGVQDRAQVPGHQHVQPVGRWTAASGCAGPGCISSPICGRVWRSCSRPPSRAGWTWCSCGTRRPPRRSCSRPPRCSGMPAPSMARCSG